jgi:hypothetical protein
VNNGAIACDIESTVGLFLRVDGMLSKRLAFGALFGAILLIVTLAGIELLASFFVPPWPARAMNPREPAQARALNPPFKGQPWLGEADSSWGMRDHERSLTRPAGTFRAIFVGDSFVDSRFTPLSLPAAVQRRVDPTERRIEAVNLGVIGTGPRSYYFRIRDVALSLQPDALLLFFYAGNDFLPAGEGYDTWPRLTDESPGASVLGEFMPRTNWLVQNRLRLAENLRPTSKAPPNVDEMLYEAISGPRQERLRRLVSYVRAYQSPAISDEKVAEILSRSDDRLLDIALPHEGEQEYLFDWMITILLSWESGTIGVPANREEAPRYADRGSVDATFSWIDATERLAKDHAVPLLLFFVPMGLVDPDYVDFWKPWPRAFAWNYICDEWQSQLMVELARKGRRFVDLADDLKGVPGTYRKLDGHWSQKGEAIVAGRVSRELERLSSERPLVSQRQ